MRTVPSVLAVVLVLLAAHAAPAVAEDEGANDLSVRLYPVGALTCGRANFDRAAEPVVAPHMVADEGRPLFGREREEPIWPLGSVDELVEILKSAAEPRYWEETDGADVRPVGESLVAVRASAAVHAAVAHELAELERRIGTTVTIEIETWHLPGGRQVARLDDAPGLEDEAVARLRAAGEAGPAVSVTAYAGQMAVAWGGREVSWLGDADVEVAQESSSSDPIVVVSNLGLMAQVMATVSEADGAVLLGLDAALADIATQRTVATLRNGTFHAPLHHVVRARPVVRLASGRWSLLDGQLPVDGSDAWAFLVRATVHAVGARAGVPARTVALDVPAPVGQPVVTAMELRFFDVRDLATRVRNLPSRVPSLIPSNYAPPEPPERPEPTAAFEIDVLVDMIRESGAYDAWEDPAAIEARNGMLIVRNTPAVLARVERTLAALRQALPWTLVADAEIVDLPPDRAAAFGGQGVLGDEALGVLAAARQHGEAVTVDALRVTSMRGARNVIRAGNAVSYLQDYEVEIAQASEIGNPVFLDVFAGSQLAIGAGLAPDGGAVQLDVDFIRTAVPTPIAKLSTPHGEVELPELEVFQLRTAGHVPLGKTLLVGSWTHAGRCRLLLITPTIR